MQFLFLIALVPLCISDISSFKIPNIYNICLMTFASLLVLLHGLGDLHRLLIFSLLLLLLSICGLGMGDVKLLVIIALAFNNKIGFNPTGLLILSLFFGAVHILISLVSERRIPLHIAFAPAIFLAFATYCVTS